jgi:CRISPR/Cas system CMR-associated protein Cmr5 small subunit
MNLEQIRAQHAFEAAAGKDADFLNLARSLPQMLQTNGLLGTWAFLLARARKERSHADVLRALADHLRSEAIALIGERAVDPKSVLLTEWTKPEVGSGLLQDVAAEALSYAGWLKRAAEALSDQEGTAG